MKKFLSILLAAMLILGMLPATALPAFAADGTWTLVTDASSLKAGDQLVIACTSKNVVAGDITSKYLSKVAATFSNNTMSALPSNAVVLTLGGSAGSWTLSNASGKLLGATALKKVAWGSGTTTWKITIDAGNATIQNGTSSYGRFLYNNTNPRFTTYTSNASASMLLPQLYRLEVSGGSTEPEQPVCKHPNKVAIGQAVEATCTTPGKTAGEKCADCGVTIKAQEEIPALGHNYVDGFCANPGCGKEQPDGGTATISFANTNQRVTLSEATQVWQDADGIITFANNKTAGSSAIANYSNPARFYKDSQIVVSCESGYIITSITVTAAGESKYKTPWEATLGSTAVVSGDNYTVNFPDGVESFTCTATAQIRAASLSVTYATAGGSAEPVVEMGGKQYSSFEEAYAEDPDTPIKLLTNLEDITVTGDLYLDLNGFNADVDSANAVFLIDTTATNAKEGNGKLTTTSEVIVDYTVKVGEKDVRYITLENSGVYTAHVLELKLTAVTLRTTAAGIYYKAAIICDPTLAAAADTYGVVLSVHDMPGADFETEMNGDKFANGWSTIENKGENVLSGKGDKTITSGSVFNIFSTEKTAQENKERGETPIYASAYLKLKNGGTVVMSTNNTSFSLKGVLERVKSATLTEAQQVNINKFNQDWEDVLALWN